MDRQPYAEWQLEMLRRHYADSLTADLAAVLGRSQASVYRMAGKLGLKKSDDFVAVTARQRTMNPEHRGFGCRFKPGQQPWNAGRTGWTAGGRSAETRFKPGTLNGRAVHLVKPLGAYRINSDGVLDVKVSDTGPLHLRWKAVHRVVWEAAYGPVPAGHVVAFKQGQRTTNPEQVTLDRLELLTKAQVMARNTVHTMPKELAQLTLLRGQITRQINRRLAAEREETAQPQENPHD